MMANNVKLLAVVGVIGSGIVFVPLAIHQASARSRTTYQAVPPSLDVQLAVALKRAGFTGKIETTLEKRLGRPLDHKRAELGRLIFFDKFFGLHQDNSCAGCHAPSAGFGDTQSIAIGVDNNNRVGPNRSGIRNQRRAPTVVNNAFYPKLMLNGRFSAISGDPFDNSQGFDFPEPEGRAKKFPPNDPEVKQLLVAQAHIPPTELPEMAGFTNVSGTSVSTSRFQTKALSGNKSIKSSTGSDVLKARVFSANPNKILSLSDTKPDFAQFDDSATHKGTLPLPTPLPDETRNEPIRDVVVERINANSAYKKEFAKVFPEVASGKPITYPMIGQALAEFQFSLTFATAPIDRFARGDRRAMTVSQKRGAVLFFGKGQCVSCHAVSGKSNEMFSDFEMHNAGVPQLAPVFGQKTGNVPFRDAEGQLSTRGNQDFGLEDITSDKADRYKFRTSPLRNVGMQPTFFHNGAFTKLEDALRYHLDPVNSARTYSPVKAGVDKDLRNNLGPIKPVLEQLDPQLATPRKLTKQEFNDLVAFLRHGLLDPRAKPANLAKKIPKKVPSGLPLPIFEKLKS